MFVGVIAPTTELVVAYNLELLQMHGVTLKPDLQTRSCTNTIMVSYRSQKFLDQLHQLNMPSVTRLSRFSCESLAPRDYHQGECSVYRAISL